MDIGADDFTDVFIKFADNPKIEKASGPTLLHFYLSVDKDDKDRLAMKKAALTVQTYKLHTQIEEKIIVYHVFPEILHEMEEMFFKQSTKIYLYQIYTRHRIDSFAKSIFVRLAIPPEEVVMETSEGINMWINNHGINDFIKKFNEIMHNNYHVRSHIKQSFPNLKDKIKLWEIMHGVKVAS